MENLLINDHIIYNLSPWNKTSMVWCYHPLHYILESVCHGLCKDFVLHITKTDRFEVRYLIQVLELGNESQKGIIDTRGKNSKIEEV